ncbi:hypothetical protein SLEP1_g2425 [Rubroshorea leprosula]|uniref:Uncharacterized protein n=1 Tax=Rubroshorea leprosula TaxID=152421 RepID=A0AAV5HN08_9ROSI|nr:hypothetical protein SLEP1_g2425 [Rubroshorea leprosula]
MQAEQWVNNMSGSVEDEPVEVEPEGRPPKYSLHLLLLLYSVTLN